ncbi:MAG: dihydropteroate synthase [Bacteroidales bacterium]|nr:dihydropteroate synthase [Bacteroidales bacterium]
MKANLFNLEKPMVMGILNLTPDSFYDGGKYTTAEAALERCKQLIKDGADIIDIGASSTRPGAKEISIEEESNRLTEVLKLIRNEFPDILISVDTYRASIARECVAAGADIINDISAGDLDPDMFATIAELDVPYIMMHMQGTPETMQSRPEYTDIIEDINQIFFKKITQLNNLGFDKIILDPGFGFGKTLKQNYRLLKKIAAFRFYGCPVAMGISRKSMINQVLDIQADEALNATTVLNTIAIQKGVDIIRVHDVKEVREAITLIEYMKNNG